MLWWDLRRYAPLHLRLHLSLSLSLDLSLGLNLSLHLLLIHVRRLLCKGRLRLVGGMCYRIVHDLLRVCRVRGRMGSMHRHWDRHTMRKIHGLLCDLLWVSNGYGDLVG